MRNIAVNDVDDLPRRVLALGSDYPANTQLARHSHRRAQFLYAMNGMMKVETDDGQWLVPPYSGVWIPAIRPHRPATRRHPAVLATREPAVSLVVGVRTPADSSEQPSDLIRHRATGRGAPRNGKPRGEQQPSWTLI